MLKNFEDDQYDAAVKICREKGRISIATIQRRLRIGFIRASLIVEAMGERGIAKRVDPDGVWVFKNAEVGTDGH